MVHSLRFFRKSQFKRTSLLLFENIFDFMHYENCLKGMLYANKDSNVWFIRLRMKLAEIFHYNKYWLNLILLIILMNVIILCIDRYPISSQEEETLNFLDFVIFCIYLVFQ